MAERYMIDGVVALLDSPPADGNVYVDGPYNAKHPVESSRLADTPTYNDMQPNMKPLTGAAPDVGGGALYGMYLFDAAADQGLGCTMELPHMWVPETQLEPHVHWIKTSSAAGDVLWQLKYRIASSGEVYSDEVTDTAYETYLEDDDTVGQHLVTSFDPIDMTGFELTTIILATLYRLGTDEDDTYGADAGLLEFDFHYQRKYRGSFHPWFDVAEQ